MIEWAALTVFGALIGIIVTVLNGKINKLANKMVFKDAFLEFRDRFVRLEDKVDKLDEKIDKLVICFYRERNDGK
ncbi:MAG: hypothetical protein DDT22_00919 [candidate division WS2 bacterium]|nr:hypothetical protein [Candidatus Lithacetigena glycinireducens]